MRQIGWNSQRDNQSFGGKFSASSQCFSTSAWMFICHYAKIIDAKDDEGLAQYVDDVEAMVGQSGIAERTIAKLKFKITGYTSLWWAIQEAGITEWLNDYKIPGRALFTDGEQISMLSIYLKNGPVILGTKKLGGLPGGHIILAVDMEDGGLICNDPYGDANGKYKDKNGEAVRYNYSWILPYINIGKNKCRLIRWIK